jgi:hypothetical protein
MVTQSAALIAFLKAPPRASVTGGPQTGKWKSKSVGAAVLSGDVADFSTGIAAADSGSHALAQSTNGACSVCCFLKDIDPLLYDLGNGRGAANQCSGIRQSFHSPGHLK